MKVLIFLIGFIFIFTSCKNSKDENKKTLTESYSKTHQEHPGKKLMEMHCYLCHDATRTEDERLGPPMIAIKKRYIFKDTSKEEFINDMQSWIKNPNEKDAKMFGAVRRFGVMQKLPYSEDDVELIADYMFDNEIEEPEWFEEHYKQMRGNMKR
ncbi:c-type cytochrome [Flavivirga spongiicola]|uniref:Cytochrome c n=1 Tax=Flavivirga spongiicola TaxID=421621 RepID=A0ABU7XLD0_9FLAO|nr:c-type cytochrome [Flavivirga sp. MEBiC05379]MDO5981233.1 c-type cytochrome [Flavivirga sp. MEBiC05379]